MWESKLRNFLERVFTILPFDKVGQRIYDGTVYAGTSPDTGTALYAMPKDAPGVKQWKEAMAYAAHANELRAFGHNEGRCLCNMSRSGAKTPHANIINPARVRLVRTEAPAIMAVPYM